MEIDERVRLGWERGLVFRATHPYSDKLTYDRRARVCAESWYTREDDRPPFVRGFRLAYEGSAELKEQAWLVEAIDSGLDLTDVEADVLTLLWARRDALRAAVQEACP